MFDSTLLDTIRDKFHHVDHCPYQGKRIFFENAGGSLTLKSVVTVNAELSAIPDNQGRDNPASKELVRLIDQGKQDMMTFVGASSGMVFVGESGTECLFRMIRAAILGAPQGGNVVGSTLEHPATVSACKRYCDVTDKSYVAVPHNPDTGSVTADDYRQHITADTRVATIIQTSPVTGMGVDLNAIVAVIREISPDCLVIVDGIQHSPHGDVDIDSYNIDAYAVSAYKVFSRHNYGFGWVSPRLSVLPHEKLDGTPADQWETGTRDTGEYATFSEVVNYLAWLGGQFTDSNDRRKKLLAAAREIKNQEQHLVDVMINGDDEQKGLRDMPKVFIVGGADNNHREGLVSIAVEGVPSAQVVSALGENGIRVHIRKSDHYSSNILIPLNMDSCIRVSMCHYNTAEEVKRFLKVMELIAA